MNALQQDLTNKVVVIAKEYFPPDERALPYRLFRVTHGFGAQPDTIGRKMFGEHLLKPGRDPRWEGDESTVDMHYGFEVERLATLKEMRAVERGRRATHHAERRTQ